MEQKSTLYEILEHTLDIYLFIHPNGSFSFLIEKLKIIKNNNYLSKKKINSPILVLLASSKNQFHQSVFFFGQKHYFITIKDEIYAVKPHNLVVD